MPRLLKDPLCHFLLLGAAIFVAFELVGDPEAIAPKHEIVITKGHVERLVALFEKTWQRPPSETERQGLIEEYIREEVYYREALAAGMDRDDIVVRRRMRQKLEFVTQDVTELVEPTDDDLRAFLQANPEAFRREPVFSFRQVYVRKPEDAPALLARLQAGTAGMDSGDPLRLIEPVFTDAPQRDVERALGPAFAAKLLELPTGEWTGPVESGYGVHLVLIEKRTEGAMPRLDEVRDAVTREWAAARRTEMGQAIYRELRGKYAITVEGG